jgi:hypothetical protein
MVARWRIRENAHMAEQVHVSSDQLVAFVLTRWDELQGEQIESLAQDMWRTHSTDSSLSEARQTRLEADTEILGSLACCKKLNAAMTLPDLISLWKAVKEGEGISPGGLIHGEESKQYRRATTFIEKLFLPHVANLLETWCSALAEEASLAPTIEARISGYEQAADQLEEWFSEFDFETADLESEVENKRALLDQLADAERDPVRLSQAKLFLYSVHRHLNKGSWATPADSPLPADEADRIARRIVANSKAMESVEKYPSEGMIEFAKGKSSTGTIAYRTVAAFLKVE